jgi:predicted N-formylglutamate amidohydrolase
MALSGEESRARRAPDTDPDAAEAVAQVENPGGEFPIVLICEHASNRIPRIYSDLGLSAQDIESHIAWDPGALGVARGLSRSLDAPLIHATVSRLLIDLNRDPCAEDSIAIRSEWTDIPGNRNLDATERERRVAGIYETFHRAADTLIEARVAAGRACAVVSIHSFTPVYRSIPRPWHIGLIFDRDARLAQTFAAGLQRDRDLEVGLNAPYSPADRVFHTLERHAERRGLAPLMIEIRNDLVRTADQQASWSSRLSPLVKEAVNRL